MKKTMFFILLIFLIIFLTGCTTKELLGGMTGGSVIDLKLDCDDGNACTDDKDFGNGTCEHNFIKNCCGNQICEKGECGNIKNDEVCNKDCDSCIENVFVVDFKCDGECDNGDIIKIKGDSSLLFDIANKDSKANDVKVSYSCTRLKGGAMIFDSYGIKSKGSFLRDDKLNIPASSIVEYSVKLSGRPTIRTELNCNLILEMDDKTSPEQFYLILEP